MQRWYKAGGLLVALALLAGLATTAASARGEADPVKVGVIYSRTGFLSAYGAEYVQGLRLGLEYATKGTNTVNGHKIELRLVDDGSGVDPAKAPSAAKDLIGQGYKIIMGTVSSGVALQLGPLAAQNRVLYISGPAAINAVTGMNRYTFRSGRQTWQDALAAGSYIGKERGRKILVFAQDSAFGSDYATPVSAVLGGRGQTVSKLLVPLSATDFTPFARQVKEAKPDLLIVAWAGTTATAMWRSLIQQGVLDMPGTTVATGLAERATWPAYGDDGLKIKFFTHYIWKAPKSPVNDWLVKKMRRQGRGQVPDLFTPDGFVAAQMLVRAIGKANGDDVEKMISALEGWQFMGPKGLQRIRPQDHAMTQPMFRIQLVKRAGKFDAVVLGRISPGETQPPVRPFAS
jgi:branched-chain amino acid transport system substrate-binding protein